MTKSRSRLLWQSLGLGLGFYGKVSVSVSKFEPGLGLGLEGYGLDYITARSNTTEGTAGDNKFEQLDSWVGAARDQNTRPCQAAE